METSAHWGTYWVETDGGEVSSARSAEPDAAPAIGNVVSGNRHRSRIARPAVRRGDEFVEVSWDAALDLVAGELDRVRSEFGNQAIFGGSYGWGSAGRLHHAQSQLHRFLNRIGGYTRSINDYSRGASQVLLPHLIGAQEMLDMRHKPTSWADIAEHTDLLVSFGGVRRSNTWVAPGGHARHTSSERIRAVGRTTRVVSLSAQRDDAFADLDAEWIGVMPATDTAVMLALIHVLIVDGLADDEFLATHTVGAEQVRRYVLGEVDGVPKTPEWAAEISQAPAGVIRALAHRMAAGRTLINVVYALQRGENGEQPVFAALTLAAFLGQIGLPGAGFAHGFGSMGDYGVGVAGPGLPTFPQGVNPVPDFIPCARISDMLLHPGEKVPYNGRTLTYPDVKLAYWAGGNPFHHHQDLRRLRTALSRLDTFVVHETHWTPTAKHADIVLPVATTLERDDIAAGAGDSRLRAMPRVVAPFGESREEFWIYTELASRLGVDFAEGLDSSQWLERIYEEWRPEDAPPFAAFWRDGGLDLPQEPYRDAVFTAFRAGSPLGTPSGRIELDSAVAGHARWREPTQWWGSPLAEEFDLHLLCNQPTHRLHSQLDMGDASQSTKVAGREPIRLHPEDAARRGLSTGDVVLVRSAQGSLLAGVVISDVLLPGVAQMHTGAWFDPSAPEIADCVNGNVNVLTRDVATSPLTQATSGAHVLVAVTRYDGPVPPVQAYDPPSTR
ncbi:molybdopterin-dependent oxidoreductase [Lentzea sp. NPDC092896]|uniref:molybdopterin-dependent oxidoreductase n=1 Tax=Lentzea sp. NPDC092896 TaxID=3364127 RepID=UPI003827130D